jgi:gliding motility-associated-like protein
MISPDHHLNMKKLIFFWYFLFASSTFVFAYIKPNKFDDEIKAKTPSSLTHDIKKKNNDLDLSHHSDFKPCIAPFGNTLHFKEGNQRLIFENGPYFSNDEISVEMWVKSEKIIYSEFFDFNLASWRKKETPDNVQFRVSAGVLEFGMHDYTNNSEGGQWRSLRGRTEIKENEWYHVAFTKNQSEINIYLNGKLEISGFLYHQMNVDLFLVGSGGLQGYLDELRVWSKALSATEIEENFQRTIDLNQTDLMTYVDFEESFKDENDQSYVSDLVSAFRGDMYDFNLNTLEDHFLPNDYYPSIIGQSIFLNESQTLTHIIGDGIWTSSDPSIAIVDSNGQVNGLAIGSSVITYTFQINGCYFTTDFVQVVKAQRFMDPDQCDYTIKDQELDIKELGISEASFYLYQKIDLPNSKEERFNDVPFLMGSTTLNGIKLPQGTFMVVWRYLDSLQMSYDLRYYVEIIDNQKPFILDLENLEGSSKNNAYWEIEVPEVVFGDNCSFTDLYWEMNGVEFNNGYGQIGTYAFPVGVTNITYVVTDQSGNFVTKEITVTYDAQLFSGGDGSKDDPFQIEKWAQLNNMRFYHSKYYILKNDLDSSTSDYELFASSSANEGLGWLPLPFLEGIFFDGQGHSISEFYINKTDDGYGGLFSYLIDSKIQNLELRDYNIYADFFSGGLVAYSIYSSFENIHVKNGKLVVNHFGGGLLAAQADAAVIKNCSVQGEIIGRDFIGGFIAFFYSSSIENSYANVDITGRDFISGLVSMVEGIEDQPSIKQSFSTGKIKARRIVGGLLSVGYFAQVKDSYSQVDIYSENENVGRIAGTSINMQIINSYSTGEIIGNSNIGGLYGYEIEGVIISNSFWNRDKVTVDDSFLDETSLRTSEMKSSTVFQNAGWDFENVWQILNPLENDGFISYPFLRSISYDNYKEENPVNPIPGLEKEMNFLSASPMANSTSISKDSEIVLTFDVNIKTSTVNSSNIIVRGQQSGNIAGEWLTDGKVVTFIPTNSLPEGEVIHIEISTHVKGSLGEHLANSIAFSFTVTPQLPLHGEKWTSISTIESNGWASVTFGNGRFVAVATTGEKRVMYSDDGENWTAVSIPENNEWASVTFGNDRFVAVAQNGMNRAMFSLDGENWFLSGPIDENVWRSVTFGNGRFVAVSQNGSNRAIYSYDGLTWTGSTNSEQSHWTSVTYGNGLFVAVAFDDDKRVMYSSDGISWTSVSVPLTNRWQTVTYGNGKFVAATQSGTEQFMYSTNGKDWTLAPLTEANAWNSVSYGNGRFIAISTSGTNPVMYSEDGLNWKLANDINPSNWTSVTFGNGKFVAVGQSRTDRVMYSFVSKPSAPIDLIPTAKDSEVEIIFTPGSNGGSPITNYEYSLDGGQSWIPLSPMISTSPVVIPSLTNGEEYSVRLRAVNVVGQSEASEAVNSTPKRNLSSDLLNFESIAAQVYSGREILPKVVIKDEGTKVLIEGLDYTVTYLNNKNVGSATVEITGIGAYTGTNSKNFIITKAPLTIKANNQTKVYGSANPSLTFSYEGLVNGDTKVATVPSISTAATASSSVGTYPITLTGGADANYDIRLIAGTLTVTKAPLTIKANNQTKVYGSANPSLTFSYEGLVNGDTKVATEPTISTTATASSNVGTYPITFTGGADANYDITLVAGALTVTKAPLTIKATNQTKVYGSANPSLTFSYEGLVNGDTKVATVPSISTAATASSSVGTYPITLTGGADANYDITLVAGTLTVTKAPLTITAKSQSKVYDTEDPIFGYSVNGLVGVDVISGALSRTPGEGVGKYGILLGSLTAGNNYAIEFVSSEFEILPTEIIEVLLSGTVTMEWGSELNLPKELMVLARNNQMYSLEVEWSESIINRFKRGTYKVEGVVKLSSWITNATQLKGMVDVVVKQKRLPQNVLISNTSFEASKLISPIAIGSLSVLDPVDNIHELSLPTDVADNKYFSISNGTLYWSSEDAAAGRTSFKITVRVRDRDGNVLDKVFEITRLRKRVEEVEIYNTFTPGGDGVNDTWGVPELRYYEGARIQVFERSGRRVFYTEDADQRWDGTFEGKRLSVGSYYWTLEVRENGVVRKGILNLLKK